MELNQLWMDYHLVLHLQQELNNHKDVFLSVIVLEQKIVLQHLQLQVDQQEHLVQALDLEQIVQQTQFYVLEILIVHRVV